MSNEVSNRHPQRLAAAGVLFSTTMLLFACHEPQANSPESDKRARLATQSDQVAPETNGVNKMSALKAVLEVYATGKGGEWQSYDSVAGVTWRDAAPVPSEGAHERAAAYKRSGNILLSGFGMVDVPNGRIGAEAGSHQDNEGNSGITLFGIADRVESIAVMKFYPSQDYAGILKTQFGSDTTIGLVANACGKPGAEDPEAREFYRIVIPGAARLYAEIYVDAEGGKYSPGSTTFEFYRSEPADRIKSMGCTVIGKN